MLSCLRCIGLRAPCPAMLKSQHTQSAPPLIEVKYIYSCSSSVFRTVYSTESPIPYGSLSDTIILITLEMVCSVFLRINCCIDLEKLSAQDNLITYHTFLDYPSETFPSIGVIVPQAVYDAAANNHAQPSFHPLPSVYFYENGELGMSLQHALGQDFREMVDPDSIPTLSITARRTTCRILVSATPISCLHKCSDLLFSGPVTKTGTRASILLTGTGAL